MILEDHNKLEFTVVYTKQYLTISEIEKEFLNFILVLLGIKITPILHVNMDQIFNNKLLHFFKNKEKLVRRMIFFHVFTTFLMSGLIEDINIFISGSMINLL